MAVFSLKGGTGKTTLSSALGWSLAERGRSVLMIDLDPQGHLTQLLDAGAGRGQASLYSCLVHGQPLARAVVPTSHANLFLVPATQEHFHLSDALISKPWREWKLKDALYALQPFPYDLVFIDLGASLSLLTYAGLFAARVLLVPVLPDFLSYLSLKNLFAFLDQSCRQYQYSFRMIWVLINRLNNHRPLDRENREALTKFYGKFLLPCAVREDLKFSQAARDQVPVWRYAPQSTAVRDVKRVADFLERIFFNSPHD